MLSDFTQPNPRGWGEDRTGQASEARENLDALGPAFRIRDDVVWHASLSGVRPAEICRRTGLARETVNTIVDRKRAARERAS